MIYSPISSPIRSAVSSLFANRGGFVPSRLFAAGEQGAWYDPSDWSTLYQDSAGTTPVTAVEQPVGLILDKSGRGNHATQTTSTSRPVLSARYNLLTKTEQFDDAAWQKQNTTVTGNATAAPDGTTTADKLNETAISGVHTVFAAASITANIATRISVAIKAAERTFALVGDGTDAVTVNLTTGVAALAAGTAIANVASASLGDGWFRVSYTVTKTVASDVYIYSSVDGVHANRSFMGSAGSGIYIWGASLVPADQASIPYQRVNTATDYDADPAKFKPYLKFDGVDDFLVTNSIDFTSTDKMTVFAGVRKLSDAATAFVVELSANLNSNPGVFAISAPGSVSPLQAYRFVSKGTFIRGVGDATVPTAPTTDVLTGIGDISGDQVALRVDGTQVASSTGDQGTGNFGNYPLYIGRRGGTTLPFNGHLYSLIVRGAQTSDTQVSQTETWVNQRTGAY